MKGFKAFIKPFEAPQKKCENKNLSPIIFILIQLSEMHGVGSVNSFQANITFLYISKISENLKFSDDFRKY